MRGFLGMIFRIKKFWVATLTVTAAWFSLNLYLGAFDHVGAGRWTLRTTVWVGIAAGFAALLLDGAIHATLRRVLVKSYAKRFNEYADCITGNMHWPAFIASGLMAALAEEPFFRGVLIPLFQSEAIGIVSSAVVFAAFHWLYPRFLTFWFIAIYEGLLFGLLFLVSGSLLVPMIAHGIHDLCAYAILVRARNGIGSGILCRETRTGGG
jgi:hypothetical protein